MLRRIKRQLFYFLTVSMVFAPLFSGRAAAIEKLDENDFIMKAWGLHALGRTEEALKTVEALYKAEGKNPPLLTVLLSQIFIDEGEFEKALKYADEARPVLKAQTDDKAIGDKSNAESLYANMLQIAVSANQELGRCDAASAEAKELAFLLNEEKDSKAMVFSVMGYCQFKQEEFSKASESFEAAFEAFNTDERKDEAAYSAAATHARLHDVETAIKWLRIPLKGNKKLWLEHLSRDKAFEDVREHQAFKAFLNEIGG